MNSAAMAHRFVCKKCGHVHVKWSSRCLSCTAYGLDLAPSAASEPARPAISHEPTLAQSAFEQQLDDLFGSPSAPVADQESLPVGSPRLVIARAPSPDPELSPEELADVLPPSSPAPVPITEITEASFVRESTGLPPLDQVLGGGLVAASVILLASPPGIGKSSLSLQMLVGLKQRCLYVSGEETREQVASTARRIGAVSNRLYVLAEKNLLKIFAHARTMRAQTIVIDSIQKMVCENVKGRAGSTAQVKECSERLRHYAKTTGTTLWIIAHVTSDGDIAGPKTIEHDVDVVLELSQGAKFDGNERVLSCSEKNRFGAANVKGHFELTAHGFIAVDGDGWDKKL